MRDRERCYKGRWYADPEGFLITTRRWWRTEPLLDDDRFKPWHPALFWQYLCSLAVWDRTGHIIRRGAGPVHLERGQLYYSLRYLGKRPGWSKDKVARQLQEWETEGRDKGKEGRVRLDPRHGGTVITLLHFDPYQDLGFYIETQPETRARHARDMPETNNKLPTGDNKKKKRALTRHEEEPLPTTSWRDIRAAREVDIFDRAPASARRTMITSAIASGPPPDDLRPWVLEVCQELELPFPYPPPPSSEELREIRDRLQDLLEEEVHV